MSKWDYLLESDAKLRSLYRKALAAGSSTDDEKYVNYFNRVVHHNVLEETAKIIKEINLIVKKDGKVGWGKVGARYDDKDPYNSRYWHPLIPLAKASPYTVGSSKIAAWLSTPVKITSAKSQLEIISIVLYYTKDLTETYKLMPKWIHGNTDAVRDAYFVKAIKKLYPHKKEGWPF